MMEESSDIWEELTTASKKISNTWETLSVLKVCICMFYL